MHKMLAVWLAIGLLFNVTPSEAAGAPAKGKIVDSKKGFNKSFSLDLNTPEDDALKQDAEQTKPDDNLSFDFDTPSEGEQNLIDKMKLKPEFRYGSNYDYDSRIEERNKEFKLKLNLDF